MSVSVVIPTTLRRDVLRDAAEAAIAAVSALDGGEVIVVANGPTEGRVALELRSPKLRVLECETASASAARNLGTREAANDIVLFTDDDCLSSSGWCEVLEARLRNADVAVATPLKMSRDGPVTTFLEYQRVYHPPPLDASTVRYPVGASTGIRRDLVRVRFDEELFSGDDAEFGDQVREEGDAIVLVPEAPPPIHAMPEDIDSITGRFWRYGRGNAIRFLSRYRPACSVPHITSLYASLSRNEAATQRRFEEIADPRVREIFATFDLMLLGSFLAGYLSEAGRILGREIVRADSDALALGWEEIAARLNRGAIDDQDWERLPIDYGRWSVPRARARPGLAGAVGENLAANAPLAEPPGPDPDLDVWADPAATRAEETWATANRILQELAAGELSPEVEPIAARLRKEGLPFREGAQMMETIAQGPTVPTREAIAS